MEWPVFNVTICGNSDNEHDQNLNEFLKVASKYGITFNDSKSIIGVQTIDLFGYQISKGVIRPDPERLAPLRASVVTSIKPEVSKKDNRYVCILFAMDLPLLRQNSTLESKHYLSSTTTGTRLF